MVSVFEERKHMFFKNYKKNTHRGDFVIKPSKKHNMISKLVLFPCIIPSRISDATIQSRPFSFSFLASFCEYPLIKLTQKFPQTSLMMV
jgi:hypothetical protein